MKKFVYMALLCTVLITIAACKNSQGEQNTDGQAENLSVEPPLQAEPSGDDAGEAETQTTENDIGEEENAEMKMRVQVGGSTFTAALENNAAAEALAEMMKNEPVVINMSDYSGFEKVGSLGKSLPADNSQITTEAGDIVLYQGNQIVMFYGSNSWSYTRLGHIEDLTGWEDALGSKDVTVTFSLED